MEFGRIPIDDAVGAILAHSARLPERRLKKGHLLSEDDVQLLRDADISSVIAARLGPEDVTEDEAAELIGHALAGNNLRVAAAFTGRCNLVAEKHGVLAIDRELLDRLNLIDEAITVATVSPFDIVSPNQMVATIKIIPFAVPRNVLDTALAVIGPGGDFMSVAAFVPSKVGMIQTRLPGLKESVLDKTTEITRARLTPLGSHITEEIRCDHDEDEVANALRNLEAKGCDLFLIFGASATVDRADVAPSGVVVAGGEIEHFGMPVDPGNLLFIGSLNGRPVVGMPGCARSPKINGFDWVLWRCLAGLTVTRHDIMLMGSGGLLKEIQERGQLREPPTSSDVQPPTSSRKIAAIVLAAGSSRRMGPDNKLLADIGGEVMIHRVITTITQCGFKEIVIVTGHEPDAIQAALGDAQVKFAHNPDHQQGMSTSLRAGVSELEADVDAAIIFLGDMPLVSTDHIEKLIQAYDPVEGRSICVPVFGRKRGNPVLWGRQYFGEMQSLSGDVGARHLLETHADQVHEVIIEDDGVLFDVDTPERLKGLKERSRKPV